MVAGPGHILESTKGISMKLGIEVKYSSKQNFMECLELNI